MLSKRYKSTEVNRRTWLHVPSGNHWSTSSYTHQVIDYKNRLLLRCLYHFESELINIIDHISIFDNEPSAVTLAKQIWK